MPDLKKHYYKRGYPVAALVGLDNKKATVWRVFSIAVKPFKTIEFNENDRTSLYSFHESIVDALRPIISEGVGAVVLASPVKTNYRSEFLNHVKKHHSWLIRGNGSTSMTFGEFIGSASNLHDVSNIVKTNEFRKILSETTSQDADRIVDTLEKRLSEVDPMVTVLYSLEEIEGLVERQGQCGNLTAEYIALTDKYLTDAKIRNRVHRLLQISKSKNIKTTVVRAETKAGIRISQFGGLICLTRSN